jgi:hypothetical protein
MQRGLINQDNIFTPKFMNFRQVSPIDAVKPFPLPPDAETLAGFFLSEDGQSFKSHCCQLVNCLGEWARVYGIDSSPLDHFKKEFIDYTGFYAEANRRNLALYRVGMPALAEILELLKHKNISINVKTRAISMLIPSLKDTCGPGAFTAISDTLLMLRAQLNLPLVFMQTRLNLARRLAVATVHALPFPTEDGLLPPDEEVHYVNSLINRNAKALFVAKINDPLTSACEEDFIEEADEVFQEEIDAEVSLESVVTALLSDLDYQQLPSLCNKTANVEPADEFRVELNRYGLEKFPVYFNDDMVEYEDNGFRLNWKAQYVLHLSMLSRLLNDEYINIKFTVMKTLEREVIFNILDGHSFKYSYVEIPNDKTMKKFQPFLTYFVMDLAKHNSFVLELLLDAGIDLGRHDWEIVIAASEYCASLSVEEQPAACANISAALSRFARLETMISLPQSALTSGYAGLLNKQILAYEIESQNQLISLLNIMSEKDSSELLLLMLEYGKNIIDDNDLLYYAVTCNRPLAICELVKRKFVEQEVKLTCEDGNIQSLHDEVEGILSNYEHLKADNKRTQSAPLIDVRTAKIHKTVFVLSAIKELLQTYLELHPELASSEPSSKRSRITMSTLDMGGSD